MLNSLHIVMFRRFLNTSAATSITKELKVLVSSNDFPESGLRILNDHFTVLQTRSGPENLNLNYQEQLELIPGCSALLWCSFSSISKKLLDQAGPNLKLVSSASNGCNHCNMDELKSRGIKLSNSPGVDSSAVAEIAVTLMVGGARRFTEYLEQVRRGEWDTGFAKMLGQEIRGSTVGVIGLGSIGQAVIKRLAGFEVDKFVYTGRTEKHKGKVLGAEYVTLDSLLTQSDFVLLSVPLTNETKEMINQTTLRKMKKNAILVNVGRGDLVNQDDLYEALKNKDIYAAGLDVTTPEPLPKDHKLLTLPNVFILPHIGGATVRTRSDMAVLAANNVVRALTNQPLLTPVIL